MLHLQPRQLGQGFRREDGVAARIQIGFVLGGGVPVGEEFERAAVFAAEQPGRSHVFGGSVGGEIVREVLAAIDQPCRPDVNAGDNLDRPARAEGAQISQSAAWDKHAPDFVQGMNHARMSNSSQRPGEEHAVERAR